MVWIARRTSSIRGDSSRDDLTVAERNIVRQAYAGFCGANNFTTTS